MDRDLTIRFRPNCILEAIKAKIKYGSKVRIVHIRSHTGLHHWGWVDKKSRMLYDFHQTEAVKHWIQLLYYEGYIMKRRWRGGNADSEENT